jgi:hypothetical protein
MKRARRSSKALETAIGISLGTGSDTKIAGTGLAATGTKATGTTVAISAGTGVTGEGSTGERSTPEKSFGVLKTSRERGAAAESGSTRNVD